MLTKMGTFSKFSLLSLFMLCMEDCKHVYLFDCDLWKAGINLWPHSSGGIHHVFETGSLTGTQVY